MLKKNMDISQRNKREAADPLMTVGKEEMF